MKYALFIVSFVSSCTGAFLKDLTDLEALSVTLIIWGICALIGGAIVYSNYDEW